MFYGKTSFNDIYALLEIPLCHVRKKGISPSFLWNTTTTHGAATSKTTSFPPRISRFPGSLEGRILKLISRRKKGECK